MSKVKVNISLNGWDYSQFKKVVHDNRATVSVVMNQLIVKYLKENGIEVVSDVLQ